MCKVLVSAQNADIGESDRCFYCSVCYGLVICQYYYCDDDESRAQALAILTDVLCQLGCCATVTPD